MSPFEKLLKNKIKKYVKLIGISDYDWHLTLFTDDKNNKNCDVYGFVLINEDSHDVAINLNKTLLSKQPDEIDNTIVHELLHIRVSEFLNLTSNILKSHVKSKKAKKMYMKQLDKIEHKVIVALTTAILKG